MSSDNDLREEVERLRAELTAVRDRLDALEERIEVESGPEDERSIERTNDADASGASPTAEGSVTETAATDGSPMTSTTEGSATIEDSTSEESATTEESATVDHGSTRGTILQVETPAKWFGWVGALALVVGIVLLVRYAIELGLLGYRGRVALAVLSGVTMVGIGRAVGRYDRYRVWARTVTGAGIAIAYFGVYAAYGFEAYRAAIGISLPATVAALSVIVVAAVGFALSDDSRTVAAEAFLFGFLTAALGLEFGTLTLVYVLLLVAGLVAICARRTWGELALASLVGSYGIYLAWFAGREESFLPGASFLVVAFALYLSVPLLHPTGENAPWRIPIGLWRLRLPALTATNALAFALLFDGLLRGTYPAFRPALYLALVVPFAVAAASSGRIGDRIGRPAPYLAVLFLVGAIVVGASTFWIAILCTALIPALFAAGAAIDDRDVRYASYGVTAFVVARLLFVDAWRLPPGSLDAPLAPARPWPFLVAVVVFAGLSLAFDRRPEWLAEGSREGDRRIPAGYAWLAVLLAVVLLGLELAGVWVSIAWAALALALLVTGLRSERPHLRHQSIALFGLTVVKVFVYDTAGLGPLSRTISFLALGTILLAAAFVYTRYVRTDVDSGEPAVDS